MNADTKSTVQASPQYREDLADFLLRTACSAGIVSLFLMFGRFLAPPGPVTIEGIVVFVFVAAPILGLILLAALAISTVVTLCLGAGLAVACHRLRIATIGTRIEALRFGAVGGAVVALVEAIEIARNWSSYTDAPREVGPEYTFLFQIPLPTFENGLKIAFDLIATIGIGALSGWLAWRPPRPAANTPGAVV